MDYETSLIVKSALNVKIYALLWAINTVVKITEVLNQFGAYNESVTLNSVAIVEGVRWGMRRGGGARVYKNCGTVPGLPLTPAAISVGAAVMHRCNAPNPSFFPSAFSVNSFRF